MRICSSSQRELPFAQFTKVAHQSRGILGGHCLGAVGKAGQSVDKLLFPPLVAAVLLRSAGEQLLANLLQLLFHGAVADEIETSELLDEFFWKNV